MTVIATFENVYLHSVEWYATQLERVQVQILESHLDIHFL